MKGKILIFLLIIFLYFSVFSNSENNLSDGLSSLTLLKSLRIDGYQIEVFGCWGDKPSLFKKIFSKKDRDFKIVFDNLKTKTFSYGELDAIIEEINGELKNIYKDGGKIKLIKIKDK